jgi:hypothetical protein
MRVCGRTVIFFITYALDACLRSHGRNFLIKEVTLTDFILNSKLHLNPFTIYNDIRRSHPNWLDFERNNNLPFEPSRHLHCHQEKSLLLTYFERNSNLPLNPFTIRNVIRGSHSNSLYFESIRNLPFEHLCHWNVTRGSHSSRLHLSATITSLCKVVRGS